MAPACGSWQGPALVSAGLYPSCLINVIFSWGSPSYWGAWGHQSEQVSLRSLRAPWAWTGPPLPALPQLPAPNLQVCSVSTMPCSLSHQLGFMCCSPGWGRDGEAFPDPFLPLSLCLSFFHYNDILILSWRLSCMSAPLQPCVLPGSDSHSLHCTSNSALVTCCLDHYKKSNLFPSE